MEQAIDKGLSIHKMLKLPTVKQFEDAGHDIDIDGLWEQKEGNLTLAHETDRRPCAIEDQLPELEEGEM